MKMLRIVKAKDPLMWYAGMVGELVPYCGQWPEAYKSREPAGYVNRVEFDDAEIEEETMKQKGERLTYLDQEKPENRKRTYNCGVLSCGGASAFTS